MKGFKFNTLWNPWKFTSILKSKWRDLNLILRGCGIYVSEIYISNFWKIKKEKKTEVTLSLILQFNLRLGGYSIWSASTSRTIYMIKISGFLAPHSLGATRSTWKNYSTNLKEDSETTRRMFWPLEVLEDASPNTRRLQDSATKSSGACETQGNGTAHTHRMF